MQATGSIGWKRRALTAMLVVGLVSFSGTRADARRGSRGFKASGDLTATSADPDARGKVKATAKGEDGRFEVSASKLDRKTSYDVIVGGVKVAALTTSGGGSGKTRLRTSPRSHDGVLGFDPRGVAVVIRNAAGQDVLVGTVGVDTTSGGHDGDVICCLPDDSGTECEDRTAAECAAQGGVDRGVGVCAADSCDGVTFPNAGSAGGDDHGGNGGSGKSGRGGHDD